MIPGSGVDVDAFTPLPEPTDSVCTVAFVSRLLDDKGVRTLVHAHEILSGRGLSIRLLLAGAPDPLNPTSIPEPLLDEWRKIPNLVMLGHVGDVRSVWKQAHIAVLPSRGGEGIPMSLTGGRRLRPAVGRDGRARLPGNRAARRERRCWCRRTIRWRWRMRLQRSCRIPQCGCALAKAGRQLVVDAFSSKRIAQEIVALYARLLGDDTQPRPGSA